MTNIDFTYNITTVTDEENSKCELDINYIPKESIIDYVCCPEWEIDRIVAERKRKGIYPQNVQYF